MVLTSVVAVLLFSSACIDYFVLHQYPNFGEALWNGMIHFIAPGVLTGDDTLGDRLVGLFQVAVGLVFYAGLVLAIVIEGITRSLARLATYESPIRARKHAVFIGGYETLEYVLASLRADIFGRDGEPDEDRPTSIAVLVPPSRRPERSDLLEKWQQAIPEIKVRVVVADYASQNSMRLVRVETAAQIIVDCQTPPPARPALMDFETMQTVFAVRKFLENNNVTPMPLIYAVISRGYHADAISRVAWTQSVQRLTEDRGLGIRMRFAALYPEYSNFFGLKNQQGSRQVILTDAGLYTGMRFGDLRSHMDNALPIGVVHQGEQIGPMMTVPAPADYEVKAGDRVAVLQSITAIFPNPPRNHERPTGLRLLVVGWSPGTRELLKALGTRQDLIERITVVTDKEWGHEIDPRLLPDNVESVVGDFSLPDVLQPALVDVAPDAIVVSSLPHGDPSANDARTAFVLMNLKRLTEHSGMPIVAMFANPVDPEMFGGGERVIAHSIVESSANSIALSVGHYRAAMLLWELLAGRPGGMLEVVKVETIVVEPTPFGELFDWMVGKGQLPLCAHTKSGELLSPPPADYKLGFGDTVLVVNGGDPSEPRPTYRAFDE